MGRLEIKGLSAGVRGKRILRGVELTVEEGDSLALLGPNGHGKSTLLGCIMGNPAFEVYEGSVTYDGKDVLSLSVDERSRLGIFLGMQNPVEVPGVPSSDFLKAAMNARREKKLSLFQFIRKAEAAYKWAFALAKAGKREEADEVSWLTANALLNSRPDDEVAKYWLGRSLLNLAQSLEERSMQRDAKAAYELIVKYALPAAEIARKKLSTNKD